MSKITKKAKPTKKAKVPIKNKGKKVVRKTKNTFPKKKVVTSKKKSSTSTSKVSKGANPDLIKYTLDSHNDYRKLHSAEPLEWDHKCYIHAKKWATHLLKTNKFEHSKGSGFGENLYTFWTSGSLGDNTAEFSKKATDSWYSEIKDYNFEKGGFTMGTGHFTQVVWKGTKKVGAYCAVKKGRVVVCANYSPPGNYLGQFQRHVLPLNK